MTMPHSDRPRRNRVNKLRALKGLSPLEVVDGGKMPIRQTAPPGVVSMMIPLAEPIRDMLRKCHREVQRRQADTVPTDALFAAAMLTATVLQAHQQLFPPVIAPPTAENLAQAKQVGHIVTHGLGPQSL